MRGIKEGVVAVVVMFVGSQVSYGCEGRQLSSIESWAYQLQAPEPQEISTTGFDLAVVDYSRDGSQEMAFNEQEVAQMKLRSIVCQRLVLSYMSIGEAEDYRFYWDPSWSQQRPEWMRSENEEWGGNYPVDYWRPEWKQIIFGSPQAYLDQIIAAGFDGVYLDRVDVYWERREDRSTSQQDMVQFVRELSAYAKALHPSFLIVPQNAEGLLEVPEYMEVIDGIAKESLFYLPGVSGARPHKDEFEYSYGVLKQAIDAGKFVLTVDYISEPKHVTDVYAAGRKAGFIPYVTVRDLDQLTINSGYDPVLQ
jgi:cysteinyl-tRNA synthetase